MSALTERSLLDEERLLYPDDDGNPMADNTLQFEWIVTIKGGLDAIFSRDPDVFVAGNLLWYAKEGDPTVRTAPDAMVVFGRPKGYRGSYMQWKEAGIPPQVVFEVNSPGNTRAEMLRKHRFYDEHGVEEYYLFDPDRNTLQAWVRGSAKLEAIPLTNGWISPRLGVRFELTDADFLIYGPDGRRFATYVELARQRDELAQERDGLAQERDELAQQREAERSRAERLAARLRELGVDPE